MTALLRSSGDERWRDTSLAMGEGGIVRFSSFTLLNLLFSLLDCET